MANDLEFGGPDWSHRKARAILETQLFNLHNHLVNIVAQALREAYEAGRREENEACAKVADGYIGCDLLARDIRKRTPNATAKESK